MPAIWEDDNGVRHYYIPPPPKPQPPSETPDFKKAVNTAGAATKAYQKNPNKANTAALNNDWNTVQEMIAEQYRLALNSSDPAKQVAELNQQYAQVFHGSKGASANIYNKLVLPGAQKEAKGETPGERNAEIQLYDGLNESDDSPTKGYDVAKADIDVHLQLLYGNGTGGVYTAAQYKAAEAAAAKDFGPKFAPVITGVGTSMQQGESYDTLLKVLQTEGPQVNPTNIGNATTLTPADIQSLEKTGLKLTPAQVTALGDLLTPEEKSSKTLTLTAGQAQLAKIDPVTLSLLMTAGIKVPQLSPQMLEIAKNSPSTFFYMEANGIDISVGKSDGNPPSGVPVFNLGHGQQLNITIHGKPLTTEQLPSGQGGNGRPSTGQTPSTVLSVYLGAQASTKGSGVVMPGSVAVANLLMGDPNLHLQVTPKTLSNPDSDQTRNLSFLVSQADSARPDYINTQLTSLLAAAPSPDSKGAAAYFTNVVNPFLTTQSNGFFSGDDLVNFWNSSPVIDNAGSGGNPKTSLHSYLQTWMGNLFDNANDSRQSQRQMLIAGGNIRQMLTGATPGLAKMLIPMMEGHVNKLTPQNQSDAIAALFDDFSGAVQIADQFPVLSTATNPAKNAPATQVANWLDSLDHHQAFYSLGVGSRLYDDAAMYGNTDLPNALMQFWPTGILASDIQNGEHDYNSTLQKQLGTANYNAFQDNKAQVLNGFFGQFSNMPDVGKPISTSNTAALKKAIIAVYGFTPQDLAPVTTHNGTQTVTTPSQATNIVNIDLSWIQNQSNPGSTVTILPFMFASTTTQFGTQSGVFFDIWNPPHKETRQRSEGRFGTQTTQVETGPTHVLIDGSAAGDALQMDPNAWKHPEQSDVKWHYSSYRDFQLSNTDYQNGTIYTLPGNQLGIGPDGSASSATDFHKQFDAVMGDIVGASQVVGLALAPFTGGVSLAITGSLGLAWGTYQGIEGYDDATSHGERFSLGNPNTRWEAISDITVAVGWATLGVGGAEAALARNATEAAGTLATATDEAGTLAAAADGTGTLASAPGTVAAGSSNTVKALGLTKNALMYGNYGLATVQTGEQIQSFSENYDNMSFWQRINAAAGIFEATVPFAIEPMNRMAFGGNWSRPARQSDSAVSDPDAASDTGLETRPQTAAAIQPDPTALGKRFIPVTLTSDGRLVPLSTQSPLIVVGSDDPLVTVPTPTLPRSAPAFDPVVFQPDVQDELATLLTSRGTISSFNYDSHFRQWLREVRATAARDNTRRAEERSLSAAGNPYLTPGSRPPTDEEIRTVSAIVGQARDTPAPAVDPQVVRDAVARYFARTTDPTAVSTAPPPNVDLTAYHSTLNPQPRVVIIGGGNVGHILQTDHILNGLGVRLLFRGTGRGQDRITAATGQIEFNEDLHQSKDLVQRDPEHFGYLDTEQGLADMRQAKILVATIPDAPLARLQLFTDFQEKGLVQDPSKTIVLIRGGQAGQVVLSQMIRDNPNWKATVVLVEDSPYGGRYNDDDPQKLVINTKRKDDVEISVLAPNGDITQGLAAMRSMFPLGEKIGKPSWPNFTVIDGSAMPFKFGYAIHPRVAFDLTNLRMTINGVKYKHYNEGVHPALGDVLGQLDQERVQLAAAYGVEAETFPVKLNRQYDLPLIPGEPFYRTMQRTWMEKDDPNRDPDARQVYKSMSHGSLDELMTSRYPQEDVPGLFTMNWLANRAGLVLPGHVEYESYIRDILRLLGMPEEDLHTRLGAYLPAMDQIPGGVPEIKNLLDKPYDREPPPEGGRETITLSGPPGGGSDSDSGGNAIQTPPVPSGSATPAGGSSPPNVTLAGYYSTTNSQPTVALVGGGNVGHTLLTDLTDAGQQARLLFRGDGSGRDRITPATGTVTFNEQLRGGTHTVQLGTEHFGYMDTPEGQQTLQQAKIIVITMPDAPQSRLQLFRQLQDNGLVQDPNKTIVLIRAGQAGQPVLSQMIRNNPNWHASVVLVEDSPYGTRYKQTPDGNVITGKRKDDVEISVLGPDGNISPGLTDMRSMFPLGDQIGQPSWPNFTVIDGSAMPFKFGYVIHPRVAFDMRNLRMTVNGQTYLHYNEGVYPELGEVLGQLDQERVQLAAAYGVQAETFPQKLNRQFDLPLIPGESFHGTMVRTLKTDDPNSRQIYVSTSHGSIPDLLASRYPQEDVPGLFTMNWFANRAGLVLPAHAEYESYIRDTLGLLGMPDEEMHTNLEGYLPLMNQIPGGIPEIKGLLDTPHDRSPPGGREIITVRGPSGPTSPAGGTTPNGGTTPGGSTSAPSSAPPFPASTGSSSTQTLANYYSTTNSQPTVVLLGGGNVGHTLLTDLTVTGQEGRLLFRGDGTGRDRITPSTGTVTFNEQLRGATHTVQLGPQHFGYMDTPEGLAAMQGAKILVATIPDMPQSRLELFRQWQENGLVQDPNKTIVLIRAGQAGQPALSQIIRDNPDWQASVVLVEDSPYGTRYAQTPDGNVITGKRKDDVEISVLGPNGDMNPGLTDIRSMFPMGDEIGKPSWPDFKVIPGSAMPFKFGYAIHPRVAFDLRNLHMTVNGQTYYHYNEGVHPALGEVLGQLDHERVQLADAYGVQAETFPQKLNRQFGLPLIPGESFYGTMQRTVRTDDPDSRQIYVSRSYGSVDALLHSRYPQEDVPGLFTMNWFANRAGLVLPAHAEYESYVRERLSELGMPDEEVHNNLEGYLPALQQIQGGIPEIKGLLDTPHDRPPPGGRETITVRGPSGPTGPGGAPTSPGDGTTPSGGTPKPAAPTPAPSGNGGSAPDAPVFF